MRILSFLLPLALLLGACSTSVGRDADFSLLLLAARNGDLACVRREIAAGADVNQQAKNGATALVLACSKGRESIVRELLAASANPNLSSTGGWTPLHGAAARGTAAMVQDLIRAGAIVDARTHVGYLHDTPLLTATTSNNVPTARALAAAGANVNISDEHGITPLMTAAFNGNAELVSLFIAHGADPTAKAGDGTTAADLADGNGHIDIAARLRSSEGR